jgi:hypothetical protein
VKMLLYDVVHMPVWESLVVIAVVAGGAIGASVWRDRRQRRGPGRGEPGVPPGGRGVRPGAEPRPAGEPHRTAEPHPVGEPHSMAEPRGPVRT